MRVIGNPGSVTQIEPSPTAMPPLAAAETPVSIVLVTLFVLGSIRSTLPSLRHSTHSDDSPIANALGCADTSIRFSTSVVSGLIRSTRFSDGQVTHRAASPNVSVLQPAGRRNSETTLFWSGSMRERVVLSSLKIQILSGLAATAGNALPTPESIFTGSASFAGFAASAGF